ncbi:uncharacterized protein [Macrobrachium rosenbergii]
MSGIDCKMCCNSYNAVERRPLVLPCGHTFCSRCICGPIKEERFTCYTCHVEHTVSSNTKFPVNFEVENILRRFTMRDSNPFKGATSKMSQSIESASLEMNRDREAIESTFQEANSQLQYYKTRLESWDEGCQRELQEHMKFIDHTEKILKWITEEIFRVGGTLHEGKKKMQEVKDSQENLEKARGAHNLFEAFLKVYECYDSFHSWVRHVEASFPDMERIQKFRQEIDLRDISPFVEGMLRQGRMFAAQTDRDKGTRYARISLDESDRLWLHVLGNPEEIPCDSFVVQYNEVTKVFIYDPCFLELGEGERSFGRLILTLHPRSSAAMQFSMLCKGTQGPSYLNTNMIKLENDEKYDFECAYFGDYENNNGSGGKALLPHVNWEADAIRKGNNGPCDLYRIRATSQDASKATQFHIFTKTTTRVAPISSGFLGRVVEGAHVLTEAISQCPDVRRIYVKDCGVLIRKIVR